MSDLIEIHPYDPAWPGRFKVEAARIMAALGSLAIGIEHVGSTAVPGLAAKPVIDMLLGLKDLDDGPRMVAPLQQLGYAHWYEDPARSERLYFVRWADATRSSRLSHLHVAPVGGVFWTELLRFRDWLRSDAHNAARYQALKQELAQRYADDREAYTAAKTEFVRAITRSPPTAIPSPCGAHRSRLAS
jgi:GrpB-like predicted nucleotidyltransferase (UPF0157 family)